MMKGLNLRRSALSEFAFIILLILAAAIPLMADGTNAAPTPTGPGGENFGQYVADHADELTPFFSKNSEQIFKQAIPLIIQMTGWIILFTMLLGWIVDVVLSRGFAFFFAPAYADWKRSLIYATGRLILSFIYSGLIGLGIVFSLGLTQAGIVIVLVVLLLLAVAFAAQIVWVLYLYRTNFALSIVFYLLLLVGHSIVGSLLAGPLLSASAPAMLVSFIDTGITPKLRAEIDSAKHDLVAAKADRDLAKSKTADLQAQVTQAQSDEDRLRRQIEDRKKSDIYLLAQIIKIRASGDLTRARDQLASFPSKFPTSPLVSMAQSQLSDVNNQLAMAAVQQKQQEADAARIAAQTRADLLERAGKGEVTLSEMRQALINKTRDQVKDLLGAPDDVGSDSWGYRQHMIVNPLTSEKHGLVVNFSQGLVQGVDYDRYGGTR